MLGPNWVIAFFRVGSGGVEASEPLLPYSTYDAGSGDSAFPLVNTLPMAPFSNSKIAVTSSSAPFRRCDCSVRQIAVTRLTLPTK